MQRLDDLLAHGGDRFGALLVGRGFLDRLQAEQHRGQLLPRLVVQLARQPAPLELLRLDDASQRVARNTRGLVDGDCGAWGEGLGQAQVGIGEARVVALLVVRDDHADRSPAGDEWDVEPAAGAESAGRVLVDLGIVERASRPAPPVAARARGRSSILLARAACRRSRRRRSPSAASTRTRPVARREGDHHEPRPDQPAQAPRDQLEQARRARSRSRAPSRPRSAPRAAPTTPSPLRTGARSRSPPPPGSQASRRAPGPPR